MDLVSRPVPRMRGSRVPQKARRAFEDWRTGLAVREGRPVSDRRALDRLMARAAAWSEDDGFQDRWLEAPEGYGELLLFLLDEPEARAVRALARSGARGR